MEADVTLTIARVKEFLRSPKHWMPIAGAFIVFFTFIAKEGLGEHWRQVAEAIDTAQYRYSIKADTSEEALKIQDLKKEIVRLSGILLDQGKTSPLLAESSQAQRIERSRATLNNIESRLAILT